MNKFEIYEQKKENNKNIRIIKEESKETNGILFILSIITFINMLVNVIAMAFTSCNYELIEKILEKL